MTRRTLASGLGLLASAFFMLAVTSRGPVPALQVTRFQGVAHPRRTPPDGVTTRVPMTARVPHGHHYLAAPQRPSDPRSSSARIETVMADHVGRRSGRLRARSRDRRLPVLLAIYHDANAPPGAPRFASGRHS